MEDSANKRSSSWVIFSTVGILLLPIVFATVVWYVSHWATDLGLFFMRPELPTLITVLLFPLTWIYLGLRRRPSVAKKFSKISALVIIAAMFVSTAMETIPFAPMAKIDREFVAPEGYVNSSTWSLNDKFNPSRGLFPCPSSYLGSGVEYRCPEIHTTWTKEKATPLTLGDLQDVAQANGFIGFTDSGCNGESEWCSLSGTVDGVNVKLSYNKDYGDQSMLILKVTK